MAARRCAGFCERRCSSLSGSWSLACDRRVELQGKLDESPQEEVWAPAHFRGGQAQVGQALEQGREDDLELDARQRTAQAVVNTMAEGHDLLFLRAFDVEQMRAGEMLLVEVRGCQHGKDALPLANLGPVKLEVLRGNPWPHLAWRAVAQQFLHRER